MFIAQVFTLYPEYFPGPFKNGLYGKAIEKKIWDLRTVNIRDYATDKHRTVDDTPFGGGSGMLLRPDVVASALDQNLNKEIQSDYIVDFGIEVKKGSTVATRENVTVPRSLIFDFHQLKRNTLSRLTGEKISKRKFQPSVSHEDCLYKVNKNTRKFFLLDCVMRFGKSFIFYEYIKRKYSNNGNCLLYTSPSPRDS